MKYLLRLALVFSALLLIYSACNAQVTTSGMNGSVSGSNNETLPGAAILAVHTPTGSQYVTTANSDGLFNISNMIVGGPYKITVTYIGYENYVKSDVYLSLGQSYRLNINMSEKSTSISGIEVNAYQHDVFDGNKTGAETYIGNHDIQVLPSINRGLNDLLRLTPQASVVNGGISIAGINNRYNSIFVDGAVNNDVFGLSASGTNGGQLGINPFSQDAIEEFQVAVAPYDVKLSGFAGAGINAITKRGTNEIKGTAYYYFRSESVTGKKPTEINSMRESADPFTAKTYGLSIGGPVIKDKLFVFINAEMQKDETPLSYSFADYTGNLKNNPDSLLQLENKIRYYGYEPGKYENPVKTLESNKILVRLDYNLNKHHKLSLRHSYTKGISIYPYELSSPNQIVYTNNWINFTSSTNSTAFEINSFFGHKLYNNLLLGYTNVRDDRDPNGADFPYIKITDGNNKYIIFGSERYSSANDLKQNILTITDNFEIFIGKHNITIGTHNEFYKMYNLYIRENFGRYNYNSVSQFIQGLDKASYSRSYSLVDDNTGDGSDAAAKFNAMQLGFYLQDKYEATRQLSVTVGLRIDVPVFIDDPIVIPQFDTTLAKISAAGYDIKGTQSGKMPQSQLMLSPRAGFNDDVFNNKKTQVRGGIGIFTSRVPFVWPAGAYSNCGMIIGGINLTEDTVAFISDPNDQYTAEDAGLTVSKPSGEINLMAKNFKFPQVARASIALDQKLPWWGLIASAEFIFTKTINNVILYNINIKPSSKTLTGSPDHRIIYGTAGSVSLIEKRYTAIYLLDNTSDGYGYNISFQLQKPADKGFSGSIAYTLGHSKGLVDGTSSQNSSQWRYTANVNGRNNLDMAYTGFDMGSRIIAFLNYKIKYARRFATTITAFYNGQSGSRYSYIYLDGYKMTSEDFRNDQDLVFVPNDQSQINLVSYSEGEVTITPDDQWKALDEFIKNDKYLSERRGKYAERNGARLPFEHTIDLKLLQDFYLDFHGHRHTLQLSFDIFNVANLINPEWGWKYYVSNSAYPLIKFEGFETDGTSPKFTFRNKADMDVKTINDNGIGTSRWYGQFGVRYIF